MFENLSPREKKLAMTVAALAPLTLVFVTFFWVKSNLDDKQLRLDNLESEKTSLLQKQLAAIEAGNRRQLYMAASLPSDQNEAKSEYATWLSSTWAEAFGKNPKLNTVRGGRPESFYNDETDQDELVYTMFTTKIEKEVGTLAELTKFLYAFYRAQVLQRIRSITIEPEVTASRKLNRENLKISMTIDVLSLADASEKREFEEDIKIDFPRTLEEYEAMIVHRDLFGLPNNPPKFQSVTRKTATTDQPTSFDLQVNDSDKEDTVRIELVSSSVPGAKLVQSTPESKTARFQFPGQPAGTYDFKALAVDSGCPPKEHEIEFSVVVSDPKPTQPTVTTKFINANQSLVAGFTTNLNGTREVWIDFRTIDGMKLLTEGETFELDDQQWTVLKIEAATVTIEVGDEKRLYRSGDFLSQPSKRLSNASLPIAKGGEAIK